MQSFIASKGLERGYSSARQLGFVSLMQSQLRCQCLLHLPGGAGARRACLLGYICGWHTVIHFIFYWPSLCTNSKTKEIERSTNDPNSCVLRPFRILDTIKKVGREKRKTTGKESRRIV